MENDTFPNVGRITITAPAPQEAQSPQEPVYVGEPIQEEPFVLNVDEGEATPTPSQETIEDRSYKFKYGLDKILEKTKDQIFQDITNGGEKQLRDAAAASINQRKRQALRDLVASVVANKGGALSPEETSGLREIVTNMSQDTDPDSVLEEAYGRQFVAELDRRGMENSNNAINDAKREHPKEVAEITEEMGTLAAKRLYAQTILQDLQDDVKNQGWVPFLADQAKTLVPGYQDYKLRGNVKEAGSFSGIGLGENLSEQRKELFRLPFPEFKKRIKEISAGLAADNPSLAVDFMHSMVGQSTSDVSWSNAVLPIDLAGLGIGNATYKGAKALIKGPQLLKDTEKAARDMVDAVANPNPSRSSTMEAVGDIKEAAIAKATANASEDLNNTTNATKRAVESLSSTFRTDNADLRTAAGRTSQDAVNKIAEQTESLSNDLLTAVQNISKIERLPEVLSTETAIRAIQENVKDTYRGIRNAVIDISKPYKESVSNTYLVDMILGKTDGTYFSSRKVAENFIKFHGLGDAVIGEGSRFERSRVGKAIDVVTKRIKQSEEVIENNEKKLLDPKLSPEAKAKAQEQIDLSYEMIEESQGKLDKLSKQVATVEQQGMGYFIRITKPVNETDYDVRNLIAETKNTKLPDSPITQWVNSFIGKVRTPEEVLSVANRKNRLTATSTPSEIFKILQDNTKEIKKLQAGRFSKGHKRWTEFQRAIENGQELIDPLTKKKGYFFKNPDELETKYLQWFNRLPDEQEVAAYFEFKRIMEVDRIFRNISEHTKQQRLGAQTHKVSVADASGASVFSDEFSGITRKKLPGGDDNAVFFGEKLGDERIRTLGRMTVKEKEELNEAILRGELIVIELYNPELRPLNGFGNIKNERIRYVITRRVETRELDWNQIPRRGGGHVEYDYDNYIKQAKIHYDEIANRYWYEGDTTIMPIQIRAMGQKVAQHLNEVRRLLKEKKEVEARAYSNANLHIDWDEVHGWFKAGKDENGKFQPARLGLDEPIQVVPKNRQLIDMDDGIEKRYGVFKNGTREGSLARLNQTQFSAERDSTDIFTLEDVGNKNKPLYQIAPATKVDPLTSMNRGLTRIIQSNFMDDYKTMSVEHWLKQAQPHLDADASEIWHAPYYYFNQGKFRVGTDKIAKANLEAAKMHINQLIGIPSDTEAKLHAAAQALADSIYNKYGPSGFVVTPGWVLPKLKDPLAFIRSVTFNYKLGLGNIPQFIVQAGNYSNILGIAGYKYAAPGTLGAQLHFWTRVNSNPAIIKKLDEYASKFNLPGTSKWKPGEFEEAFHEFRKTGFGNVGREYAALDDPSSTKIVGNNFDTFLEWGRLPFSKGEQNSKYGAWYTAYREFRDKNPVGKITEADRATILQRADLLNVNMTRASSSMVHQGIWSVPTQFYTYQLRLLELFFGSRLTGVERARMFATNALLYGVPMATGLTGLPLAGYIRQKAMEEGYVTGANAFTSSLMEGLPSMLGAVITGNGDYQAGTFYDIPDRFGTKGFEFLGGINRSDKGFMDVVGGASWSVVKGTVQQTDGFRTAMISMIRQDNEAFPLVAEDLVGPLKEISSVNTVFRVIAAAKYGQWMSKNETYLADTSTGQAIFSALFGLKDQGINDIQTKLNSLRSQKDYETEIEKRFQKEFHRGLLIQNSDPEQAHVYFTRASAWLALGGYRQDRVSSLVSRALDNDKSLVDKTNWDFYIKKAPDAQAETRKDAMKTILQLKDKRGAE